MPSECDVVQREFPGKREQGLPVFNQRSGTVDAAKGTLTLISGSVDVGFDYESGSMIKGVKVGDYVMVKYKEVGRKKKATSVTSMIKIWRLLEQFSFGTE